MKLFADRRQAGLVLARHLVSYSGRADVTVLALPRGGVPVAFEVAEALGAPLEVFCVRKIGAPWNPEFAIGSLASGGSIYMDDEMVRLLHLDEFAVDRVIASERAELGRREKLFRGSRPFPELRDRVVILVDDGLATGSTMRVAVQAVRTHNPREVIVAVPVGTREAYDMLRPLADNVVCAMMPEPFYGVGVWYEDFEQTTDAEVLALLRRSAERHEAGAVAG